MTRRWERCTAAFVLVLLTAVGRPQGASDEDHRLTIWVVRPVTAAERALQKAQADIRATRTYHESTAGSFGTSASDAGQTAGSYGTSASNVGQNAGSVGQTAGSYGGGASSLPSDVPSQTAGSYGVTAGSIGTNASDYTGAPGSNGTRQAAEPQAGESLLRTPEWQKFVGVARNVFHEETVTFTEVSGLELHTRLARSATSNRLPDVLLLPRTDYPGLVLGEQAGTYTPERQQEVLDRMALIPVGRSFPWPVTRAADTRPLAKRVLEKPFGYALGMVRAPHAAATREFLDWLRDEYQEGVSEREIAPDEPVAAPVTIAKQVADAVFSGGSAAGWADPQMAQFKLTNAASLLYGRHDHVPADMHLDSGVLGAAASDRLAVVLLNSEVVSSDAFGQIFPLVVLRRTAGGPWKVLHLTVDLPREAAENAYRLLAECVRPVRLPEGTGIAGPASVTTVSLASPKDGEQRAAQADLELWWDDTSHARVLVVEYQSAEHAGDDRPHLFLVNDTDAKLQTRVTVPFGMGSGVTRWRVWSVGQGGNVEFTPWQHVTLLR